jgi:hypothetical protein
MSQSPFLTLIEDETQFRLIRPRLLSQPTPIQSQAANSTAIADIGNGQTDGNPTHTPAATKNVKNPTATRNGKLFIHYTHEGRLQSTKRDPHRVYEETFQRTPASHVTLTVGGRNRRDAQHELIRKRPSKSLLANRHKKRKDNKEETVLKSTITDTTTTAQTLTTDRN